MLGYTNVTLRAQLQQMGMNLNYTELFKHLIRVCSTPKPSSFECYGAAEVKMLSAQK